jgi:SAM-dependent MidA family methyltransferase
VLPPEGGVAEVNLGLAAWVDQTSARLAERGLLLVLDYGYPAENLFSRTQGTLLTYYRHTMGSDPLVRLGRQDLSAHVDFTTLATAAHQAGLDVLGVTSQRTLLRNLGVEPLLRRLRSPDDRRALEQLLDPHGLGRIGALFAGRGLEGYTPVGLVGGRDWPVLEVPEVARDDGFMDLWRDAFAGEEQEAPTCQ